MNKFARNTGYKLTLFLIALIIGVLSLQAQTKDETIEWIKSKITSYGDCTNSSWTCHYSNDATLFWKKYFTNVIPRYQGNLQIDVKETVLRTNGNGGTYDNILALETDDITNVEMRSNFFGCDGLEAILLYSKDVTVIKNTCSNCSAPKPEFVSLVLRWTAEPDLKERMFKAFKHILELTQKKEAF